MVLTVDGVEYDVMCRVRRQGDVRDTDISGEMLDGSYFHDVAGTYYDYEISLLYPLYNRNKYAALYEALTQPVDGHTFVLPYNNTLVTLTAKVDLIDDELLELENGERFWRSLSFTLTANTPTKQMSLSEVIVRGIAPFPDVAKPAEGTSYTWDGAQWVETEAYIDADTIYY